MVNDLILEEKKRIVIYFFQIIIIDYRKQNKKKRKIKNSKYSVLKKIIKKNRLFPRQKI